MGIALGGDVGLKQKWLSRLLFARLPLRGNIREERHVASALDGLHDVALFIRGNAGTLLGEHLRMRIRK